MHLHAHRSTCKITRELWCTQVCRHKHAHVQSHTYTPLQIHVHMQVLMQEHPSTCTHTRTPIDTCRCVHACRHTCMHTKTCTHALAQINACTTYTCIQKHACVRVHRCMNSYTCAHIYVHKDIRTHTDMCMRANTAFCYCGQLSPSAISLQCCRGGIFIKGIGSSSALGLTSVFQELIALGMAVQWVCTCNRSTNHHFPFQTDIIKAIPWGAQKL